MAKDKMCSNSHVEISRKCVKPVLINSFFFKYDENIVLRKDWESQ